MLSHDLVSMDFDLNMVNHDMDVTAMTVVTAMTRGLCMTYTDLMIVDRRLTAITTITTLSLLFILTGALCHTGQYFSHGFGILTVLLSLLTLNWLFSPLSLSGCVPTVTGRHVSKGGYVIADVYLFICVYIHVDCF